MKPDKHFLGIVGIILAAFGLIALTWVGTMREIRVERQENLRSVQAVLGSQALGFSEQINQQILTLDDALRTLVATYESAPRTFDLKTWHGRLEALNGLSHDIIVTDEAGIIRQSTVDDAINRNISTEDCFLNLSKQPASGNRMFIGSMTVDTVMRQWHMNVGRALHHPDGSFAGIITLDYPTASITNIFNQVDLGPGAFEAVVGLDDGKLRATVTPQAVDPNATIGGTAVFAAIERDSHGIWVGPSPIDGVTRMHAFHYLPDRALAVVVAMNLDVAMHPTALWRRQVDVFAGCITLLLAGMALLLLQRTRQARLREAVLAGDKSILASANTQLEAARALATAKAEQLEATLGGMTDGVSMFDANMRLVEWNDRFPEVAGVPAEILRVGLPMEEILRAQISSGQYGRIDDEDIAIAAQMAELRNGPYGIVERQRPDGHTLELRRKSLPEGGFVTLYADITEHKQAEEALRDARASAETATAAKSRFMAVVSHEIRTPLNALLNTLQLLAGSALAPAQQSLLAMARQSGMALSGLINDILELSQVEAGKLMIRPSLFDLRPLMASSVEMFEGAAAERGIALHVSIAETVPELLHADAGRLRQVLLNLLSNAMKYADGKAIRLEAIPGRNPNEAVMLLVKDRGPVIDAAARSLLFQPFSRLQQSNTDALLGSGLGLSICQELVSLMGGTIGCEPWTAPDGQQGNAFWLTLPGSACAIQQATVSAVSLPALGRPRRRIPRTAILLVDDVVANQVVAATMLRREGHRVDIASTGEASVEAVQRSSYDLVLMDIFMPQMTGHEAAAAIRSLPEPARSIPIVALTGDASPEHDTTFRASGMDATLSKPVSLPDLLDAVYAHVWSGQRIDRSNYAAGSTPTEPERRGPPEAKSSVLATDRILELRSNLSPHMLTTLIEECLVDLDHRMPKLRQALAAGSVSQITEHSHAMVGMAGSYGMASLERSLRAIMSAARTGDLSALDTNAITKVESNLDLTGQALRELLQDVPA